MKLVVILHEVSFELINVIRIKTRLEGRGARAREGHRRPGEAWPGVIILDDKHNATNNIHCYDDYYSKCT